MNRSGLTPMSIAVILMCLFPASAHAQGSAASSLSGVIVDANGGVIPGATVLIKNVATGVTLQLGISTRTTTSTSSTACRRTRSSCSSSASAKAGRS